MPRYGMVIDLRRCVGCTACTAACKSSNTTGPGVFWSYVHDLETGAYPHVRRTYLPVLCHHCADAPCVTVCPTKASHYGADGLVLVDTDKCVGCGYCIEACPYGVRYQNPDRIGYFAGGLTPYEEYGTRRREPGAVEKCNFCVELLEQGRDPACVRTCIGKARFFGDLDDPDSQVAGLARKSTAFQLLQELETKPAVYYLPD